MPEMRMIFNESINYTINSRSLESFTEGFKPGEDIRGMDIRGCKKLLQDHEFREESENRLSAVGKMYIVLAHLHNARACLYPNKTSTYFDVDLPYLEEYLFKSYNSV